MDGSFTTICSSTWLLIPGDFNMTVLVSQMWGDKRSCALSVHHLTGSRKVNVWRILSATHKNLAANASVCMLVHRMDNSGWWWWGGRLETSMCHFPLERPLPVHSTCLIKGDTVVFRCLFLQPPVLLLPFQTRSIFCLLWTSYSLPPVCSAIVNNNQWR